MSKRFVLLMVCLFVMMAIVSYAEVTINIEPNNDRVIDKSKNVNIVVKLTSDLVIDMSQIAIEWNGQDITAEFLESAASQFNDSKTEITFYYPISATGLQPGQHNIAATTGNGKWFKSALIIQDLDEKSLYFSYSMPLPAPFINDADILSRSLSAAKSSCSWLSFGYPTTVSENKSCYYGSKNCAKSGWYHTGIDYSGSGTAVSVANGTVVHVEKMSSSDHGMGNNVIVKHTLSDCSSIYSSYSHLDSIDSKIGKNKTVKKGQKIGDIGCSGYKDKNYWCKNSKGKIVYSKHLHFETKTGAVTGNPKGVGKQNSTCQSDPNNAKANTCWGYVKSTPDNYGYRNPKNNLGK